MKHLLCMLSAMLLVALAGCSDNDNPEPDSDLLVGTWECYKQVVTEQGESYEELFGESTGIILTVEFRADNTCSILESMQMETGGWGSFIATYRYVHEGNTVTQYTTGGEQTEVATILDLTQSELTIYQSGEDWAVTAYYRRIR